MLPDFANRHYHSTFTASSKPDRRPGRSLSRSPGEARYLPDQAQYGSGIVPRPAWSPILSSHLDPALHQALSEAIGQATGRRADVERATMIGGGSISRTLRIDSDDRCWFVKLNDPALADMFAAEVDGLSALAVCSALRVPGVVGHGVAGRHAWLLLDHLALRGLREGRRGADAGRALAELHRIEGAQYGWHRDNYIGRTPQFNAPHASWPAFFARRRLLPQLDLARRLGHHGKLIAAGERLADKLPALFADHRPPPSLLHGDLWSGNAASDETGALVLFDPAVHFGDRESDLAMSELFGGFPDSFYAAYGESWPLADGFERRKILYQLYHVLNHLNLFGGGYLLQAERMIARLLAEIGG
ncbi:fructosamine kinase family protein [Accumulibacter sp.]|uniref:fructosamine kinase family protein n=1 Tax=Accumulibacter sp. TaxID=2053492 RepID=UPI00262DF463|nr:fructosamine kinase family protein [Accumulibacter sp.]